MNPNFWFAVMHVLTRLKLFGAYLKWCESFLNSLGDATDSQLEEAKEWILSQADYPSLEAFRNHFGYGWNVILKLLKEEQQIDITDDMSIFWIPEASILFNDLKRNDAEW